MSRKGQGYYVGTPNDVAQVEMPSDVVEAAEVKPAVATEAVTESVGQQDPAHNAPSPMGGVFPSNSHAVQPPDAPKKLTDTARHGAFAHHRGKAEGSFSISHNGMTVDFREHQAIDADDGLFDAIKAANAPVVWK